MKKYNKIKTRLIIDFYIDEICRMWELDKAAIFCKRKDRDLADARAIVCYMTKQQFPESKLVDIADEFGQNHPTIKHGINKIEILKQNDAKIKNAINLLRAILFDFSFLEYNNFSFSDNYNSVSFIKKKVKTKIIYHSCGNIILYQEDNNDNFVELFELCDVDVFDAVIIAKSGLSEFINLLKN